MKLYSVVVYKCFTRTFSLVQRDLVQESVLSYRNIMYMGIFASNTNFLVFTLTESVFKIAFFVCSLHFCSILCVCMFTLSLEQRIF